MIDGNSGVIHSKMILTDRYDIQGLPTERSKCNILNRITATKGHTLIILYFTIQYFLIFDFNAVEVKVILESRIWLKKDTFYLNLYNSSMLKSLNKNLL